MLNYISVCLLCTGRRGTEGEGEEEKGGGGGGRGVIHGRCHKTRDINKLPGLQFGK
jgi:hypothetical protein